MKLDAGDPFTYARINGIGASVTKIVDWLQQLPSICIQSMFVTDEAHQIDNSTDGPVMEWVKAVELVRATAVHIYTLDRGPALESLKPVPRPSAEGDRGARAGIRNSGTGVRLSFSQRCRVVNSAKPSPQTRRRHRVKRTV